MLISSLVKFLLKFEKIPPSLDTRSIIPLWKLLHLVILFYVSIFFFSPHFLQYLIILRAVQSHAPKAQQGELIFFPCKSSAESAAERRRLVATYVRNDIPTCRLPVTIACTISRWKLHHTTCIPPIPTQYLACSLRSLRTVTTNASQRYRSADHLEPLD